MSKIKTKHIIASKILGVFNQDSILAMNISTNKYLFCGGDPKVIYSMLNAGHGIEMNSDTPKSWVLGQMKTGTRLIR